MIRKINKWLDLTIKTKSSQAEEIRDLKNQLDDMAKEIEIVQEKYKNKFLKEHKKRVELEKESKTIIEELEKEIKLMEKESKKK